MKYIVTCLLGLLFTQTALSQQYERVWMFGESNTLDFSGGSPVPGGIPVAGGNSPQWYFHRSGAVCNAAGQLQFWVKLQSQMTPNAALTPNVFDRNGDAMPNGNLLSNYSSDGVPIFIPFDGDTNMYYVFYVKNGGLLYSVVDMRLNGGMGDIVATSKNTRLSGWNEVIDYKVTAVRGCKSIWIVCRSRIANEFLSYEVTSAGVSSSPVVSSCGLLPVSWYANGNNINFGYYARGGVMKASPDGRKLAIASNASLLPEVPEKGGIEIFDFEPCSGKVSNPILLASGSYYGACFSPDNSKLYTSAIYERRLYQFDLSLPTTAAITASRTLILSNPTYNGYPESWLLGDAKRGLDGKIYLGNYNCDNVNTNAMHVIEHPNLTGLACSPVLNAVSLGPNAGCTGFNLPADIVTFPQPDTVAGNTTHITACLVDSIELDANHLGRCHRWLDGIDGQSRYVKAKGVYLCAYYRADCAYQVDTFIVSFPLKPVRMGLAFSCPNEPIGKIAYQGRDTTTFLYTWYNSRGLAFQMKSTSIGDTARFLDTGTHVITFSASGGCIMRDTFNVGSLPMPVADFLLPAEHCKGIPLTIKNVSDAPLIRWQLGNDTIKQKEFNYTFWGTGIFPVRQIVKNLEGCSDTLDKPVRIRDFVFELVADKQVVNKNERIRIEAKAGEPFKVLYWSPANLFADQNAYSQILIVDTPKHILVKGISELGCEDTTSIFIDVRPHIFMPSAFSPNRDGRNDRFKPISAGASVFTVYFYVYNRWGQMVYSGQGPSARDGWDGMHKGMPCEVGTYYYTIQIETPQGEVYNQNGDVTLVR